MRLQQFKGPTLPRQRAAHHLRAGLGPPNRLLNFVHAADEPADVLREVGLLLDRPTRRVVIERMRSGRPALDELARLRDAVYRDDEPHDLLPAPALSRLVAVVQAVCPPDVVERSMPLLAGLLDRDLEDAALAWHHAHGMLWPYAAQLGVWDYVVVGSSVCPHDERDSARVIPDPVHGGWDDAWLERRGGPRR